MGTAVSISGMHRSETSMVTWLLYQCGLILGSDTDILPPYVEDNPEGFLENHPCSAQRGSTLCTQGAQCAFCHYTVQQLRIVHFTHQ